MRTQRATTPVTELRVALTTTAYERLVAFYCAGLGLAPAQLWTSEEDRAVILALGEATLELFDEAHAAVVDQLEVGEQVSGPVRFALRVHDVEAALARVLEHGGTLVHAPVVMPWGHKNARVRDPDGLQVTLFEDLSSGAPAGDRPRDQLPAVAAQDSGEAPLACDLTVLDPETRAAHIALGTHLLGEAAQERQELDDGYAFRFAPEAYDQVTAFVANERRCCPFVRFEVVVEPDGGPLLLRMRGREGVKAILAAELGI